MNDFIIKNIQEKVWRRIREAERSNRNDVERMMKYRMEAMETKLEEGEQEAWEAAQVVKRDRKMLKS